MRRAGAVLAPQGWKLHVSASVSAATTVLERVLPVLLAESAPFKVANSLTTLLQLNQGDAGPSQVGKFITVYPQDDAQAIRLAAALDAATRDLPGPAIPSDRPLAPGSLVHYRYGDFGDQHTQTPLGLIVPAVRRPDGGLEPDDREQGYRPPAWAPDPFLAAGVARALPAPQRLIGDRFLIVSVLHTSPRGSVYLAADLQDGGCCVLKRARRDATAGPDGRDARDRLRHEADVLARLAPDPRLPAPRALLEQDGDLYLALEDLSGETLERQIQRRAHAGCLPAGAQIVAWGQELAALLGTIHARGFVYRDLKSTNVIAAPDGRLCLLDFELAHPLESAARPAVIGTRGYAGPQQRARAPVAVTDDVYGLGALLYFLATGAEPSRAPHADDLLGRPVTLLNPAIGPALAAVITRCLAPTPADRFPNMAAVAAALSALFGPASVPPPPFGGDAAPAAEPAARARARALAHRLGDTLCARALPAPGGGRLWASSHRVGSGTRSRDINTGSAGALLALAEVIAQGGDPRHRGVLAEAAQGLHAAPRVGDTLLPGLYVGEAGIGAALLRAGQVLEDAGLVAAAAGRGQAIARLPYSAPYASPDLFNGTAGRLRFHLLLWDATGAPDQRAAALAAGAALLAASEDAGAGALRWPVPPGYAGLSARAYLGYAHGAAGIGDALLDLFEATGESRFQAAAMGAARWLARQAVPTLADGSGYDWPTCEGDPPDGAFWCRGAGGIGRFFLHAAAVGGPPEPPLQPDALALAAGAARMVARGTRWAGATQCHGLAGNIEFLLDCFQATQDPAYLAEARGLARLLDAFAGEQAGHLVWPSEAPTVFSPDYLVGYAGVAVCLLRLADPEHLPHQLSRRGFGGAGAVQQRGSRC